MRKNSSLSIVERKAFKRDISCGRQRQEIYIAEIFCGRKTYQNLRKYYAEKKENKTCERI